jgi:hypothetical protein
MSEHGEKKDKRTERHLLRGKKLKENEERN